MFKIAGPTKSYLAYQRQSKRDTKYRLFQQSGLIKMKFQQELTTDKSLKLIFSRIKFSNLNHSSMSQSSVSLHQTARISQLPQIQGKFITFKSLIIYGRIAQHLKELDNQRFILAKITNLLFAVFRNLFKFVSIFIVSIDLIFRLNLKSRRLFEISYYI